MGSRRDSHQVRKSEKVRLGFGVRDWSHEEMPSGTCESAPNALNWESQKRLCQDAPLEQHQGNRGET